MVVFSRDFPIAVCNRIDVPFTFVIHVMHLLAFESTVVFVIEILAEILIKILGNPSRIIGNPMEILGNPNRKP